jgi:chemotaxis-related protein WspB
MQLLTFTAGGQTYAIEARSVVEVLPAVPVRSVPRLPNYVLGVVDYRGKLIPVIDLAKRLVDEFSTPRLSTRLLIVDVAWRASPEASRSTPPPRLGIVAENMVSTLRSDDVDTVFPAMHLENSAYLGRILRLNGQTVHMLIVENLLPAELASGLFSGAPEPSSP